MRDPFPLPPISHFLLEPFATFFGLETLPLHGHEILSASLFYHCIFIYIAPALSTKLFASRYNILPTEGKLRWNMKCVSFIQSTSISLLSLWVMVIDKERKAMSLEERVWGYTGAAGMVQGFAVGYFVWDTYIMVRYTQVFGQAMLAHGIACTITFSLGFRPVFNYYGCVFMLYELSTPLLNIHWFMDKVGMTGSSLQIYNGIALIVTFFAVRLVYGAYMSIKIYSDTWTALQLQCSSIELESKLQKHDRWMPSTPLSNCPLPTWLLLFYLGGHLTLNSLNVYWFAAMIRAIKRRADLGPKPKSLK